jgi:glycosidase
MGRDAPPDPETDQQRSFEKASRIHARIRKTPSEYPAGWVEQVRFRERYDLPPFRPPRFLDGARVHETVDALEAEFDVDIGFTSTDVDEGWWVEIDRELAFGIDRYRDDAANTVIEMSADRFERRVREAIAES